MKKILILVVVLLAGLGAWSVWNQDEVTPVANNFSVEGNVIINSPGLTPDVWYLVYEEQGAPALSVKLDLSSLNNPDLKQGERVRVQGYLENSVVAVSEITRIQEEEGIAIQLFYYNPELDQGPGGAQCSRAGLVSVERVIPETTTPLRDSIRLLLRGELTTEEREQGITTEFPLSGLTLNTANIRDSVAYLEFSDPQQKTTGGSCRVSILWAQVEATAKQFPSVSGVKFEPEELFQP